MHYHNGMFRIKVITDISSAYQDYCNDLCFVKHILILVASCNKTECRVWMNQVHALVLVSPQHFFFFNSICKCWHKIYNNKCSNLVMYLAKNIRNINIHIIVWITKGILVSFTGTSLSHYYVQLKKLHCY